MIWYDRQNWYNWPVRRRTPRSILCRSSTRSRWPCRQGRDDCVRRATCRPAVSPCECPSTAPVRCTDHRPGCESPLGCTPHRPAGTRRVAETSPACWGSLQRCSQCQTPGVRSKLKVQNSSTFQRLSRTQIAFFKHRNYRQKAISQTRTFKI